MEKPAAPTPFRTRLLAAARTLRVDHITSEVLRTFERAGVRSILLKGPTLQRELYGDTAWRSYSDTDLLVSPADLERAGAALTAAGFHLTLDHRDHGLIAEPHAQEWGLTAGAKNVDLHWRIPGIGAPAERAWRVLIARTQSIKIGGGPGERLDQPATALLVALHAAHHGGTLEKPRTDLELAVDRLSGDTWGEAALLAGELDAIEAFVTGLRLVPAGVALADRLDLPTAASALRRLMASGAPPGSLTALRVIETRGVRGRARAIRGALFPGADFMRASSPLARRGRRGLALAYLVRAAARARQLPTALRAVRRSRGRRA
jgi:hypothetical protein